MASIRTFVAVALPEDLKARITEFQAELKRYPARVSWTRAEGIHITLKFLGNVEEARIDRIEHAVRAAVAGSERPRLSIERPGAFPNWRNPRVFWIGVSDEDQRLTSIQGRLEDELAAQGFPKEKRPFRPHLTLGRVKSAAGIEPLIGALQTKTFAAGTFEVSEVVVMKSELKPTGAVYSALRVVEVEP